MRRVALPSASGARARGFTLVEVLVALVIVAFGMGAVLAALSASAGNVGALREKTVAQWIALNRVADARLNLQAPQTGTTEGDIKGFGNADWHWQQIVTAVQEIPGLLQITVKVRRNKPGSVSSKATSANERAPDWVTTVIGFRGDAVAAASGETPDWAGTMGGAGNGSSSSSSSSSGGTLLNPGSPATPGTSPRPGSSSSGGSTGGSSSGGP